MTGRTGPTAAFFDVDDTLVAVKSLASFADHYQRTVAGERVNARLNHLREMAANVVDRVSVNRGFFQAFAGESWASLMEAGEAWYAGLDQVSLYSAAVLAALHSHRDRGERVVFVSGSWLPCLAPIGRIVGVSEILCSVPVVEDGVMTGEIARSMVGDGKAVAVRDYAAENGISLSASTAYGDDSSDEALLAAVGHGVVVGNDPVLHSLLSRRGWERLDDRVAPPSGSILGVPPD
jgi:HAD superfamily hydrolase (TIGR01490 family)